MFFIKGMKTKTRKILNRNVLHKRYEDENEENSEQKCSS
ncbi:hypothetical protein J2S19_001425 [Metabacillus malikii]|uniref:YpzI family protein n=1 Tax=Metabacillus malikii TaxID=1504265 RepID=A0ABT9ZD32_9BACI|nr:hypothetical protein [Metabacillus malikii]